MEDPEDSERRFDLRKYQQPRISARYVIRIIVYLILLITITWVTTSRLRQRRLQKPRVHEIPVEIEPAPEQGSN